MSPGDSGAGDAAGSVTRCTGPAPSRSAVDPAGWPSQHLVKARVGPGIRLAGISLAGRRENTAVSRLASSEECPLELSRAQIRPPCWSAAVSARVACLGLCRVQSSGGLLTRQSFRLIVRAR